MPSAIDIEFTTRIVGVAGQWPAMPKWWSFSSLREAEQCPRRWMLSRATYPRVWQRDGYPSVPRVATTFGHVLHQIIEEILRALQSHGCRSVHDPTAVAIIRDLGGFSTVARRAIEHQLTQLAANPRAHAQLDLIHAALERLVPDLRTTAQAMLVRTGPTGVPRPQFQGTGTSTNHVRSRLGNGAHPEVGLRSTALHFHGRLDLLTLDASGCQITDFKSGAPTPHHADQVRLYALLWLHDHERNPDRTPVTDLVLSYPGHDEHVPTPPPDEYGIMARELQDRITNAEGRLGQTSPPAYPSPELCVHCDVRHLCEEYWQHVPQPDRVEPTGTTAEFGDCTGCVINRNGPRSWILNTKLEQSAVDNTVLLRTPTEDVEFAPGDRLRLLNVRWYLDENTGWRTVTITRSSETYILTA